MDQIPCVCGGVIETLPEFRDLIEPLPDLMICPRRQILFGSEAMPATDRWQRFKTNGDRVCSFCGSLHPDDFLRLVDESAHAPPGAHYGSVPEIEPSNKPYKIYIHRQTVENAMQGGIKFYTQHLRGMTLTGEQQLVYALAIRSTRLRLERQMTYLRQQHRGKPDGTT